MPSASTRRKRIQLDDSDESRHSTPNSSAPNDGKRLRRSHDSTNGSDDGGDAGSSNEGQSVNERHHDTEARMHNGIQPGAKPAHQPGAIVRVRLTNFVTYTSAEFFPGPNLNMVIGPNGTGKSTLVCAICLGLGWGTQYLGRAKDAAEFVKHGSKEATIEIELQRAKKGRHASGANPVITRTIKRDGNKSTFTLNNKSTSGKAVMALAQSFDIQIDNLCQFLPQDKVVEFAQMTPIQILESTQRAAAPPEALEMHQNLVELRRQQREHGYGNKDDQENLTQMENRQAGQETEVTRLRERAEVQKQLRFLQQCRPIPQFSDARRKQAAAKTRYKELQAEVKNLKDESGPAVQKVQNKILYVKEVQAARQQAEKEAKNSEKECSRLSREVENLKTTIEDCTNQDKAENQSINPTKQEINRDRLKIAQLIRQKEQPPEDVDFRAINQEIQDKRNQIRDLQERNATTHEKAIPLKDRYGKIMIQGKELAATLKSLDTQLGQQESRLETASNHAYRAWKWIEANRDKFSMHVYGPPIIECSLTEPDRAKQIESLLQENDFKIITTQCKEDFKLLQRELIGKQRLSNISLRTCSLSSLDSFRRPMSADQMEEYGIKGWAVDFLQGPATVVAMLCQERMLHQTAIAGRDISEQKFGNLSRLGIKSYVDTTSSHRFIRRAEYGAAGESSEARVLKPAKYWNAQTSDSGRKAELTAKLHELMDEKNDIKAEIERLKAESAQLVAQRDKTEEELKTFQDEKDAKQRILTEFNGLDVKIKQLQDKIAKNEDILESMRDRLQEIDRKRTQATFDKAASVLKYIDAVHVLRNKQQELLKIDVMLIEAKNDADTLGARNQYIVDTIRSKEKEEHEAAETARTTLAYAKDLMKVVKKLRDTAEQMQEQENEPGLLDLLVGMSTEPDLSEQDLNDRIDIEKAKLELTEGGDTNIIREYEERQKKIEKLRKKIETFATQQQEYMAAINEVRGIWEPQLDRLVSRISDAFGESFARIGCAGQVAVYKASSEDAIDCTMEMGGVDNGLDFENWAMHISVKFRQNEPLSLLDSHRQSGGERAVSTIFYLMALQSLSRAPFRVVDEINQGMDPRNERMVHGRMVDIAAADDTNNTQGSQYFLITPKLLSGLKYRPGMTVLCIVSGENMPNPEDEKKKDDEGKWFIQPGQQIDFAAFADKARALGLNRLPVPSTSMSAVSTSFGSSMRRGQTATVGA